ncbi:MAG: hypothetical protein ACD_44C00033G0011 [uncultured bacterium]|nr:MAG: hypothetical protein ACD_44C00033G0011 [uncultured bacterium]
MRAFHPKIVTDQQERLIAVQIDYADWLKIQAILQQVNPKKNVNLKKYAGSITLNKDPLKYQKRTRNKGA